MQKQLATLTSLEHKRHTAVQRADIWSTFSTSKTNLADCDREETSIVPFLG